MKKVNMPGWLISSLLNILLCLLAGNITAQKSIPGNIAFGDPTRGGLDGKVIRVTTLDSGGKGSLREAIETEGPRIVVFEVGGVIDLNQKNLEITGPYLTIAGQTAPFPGITIIRGGLSITTHDVLVQHIRVRPGDAGRPKKSGWSCDGLQASGSGAFNIIVDHCSFTWSTDENLSASGPRIEGPDSTSHKITFSNNIIAECLYNSSHEKGIHSMGSLIHDFCRDIAIVGNLYAHNGQRNPYFKAYTTGVIVNNLIYNPGMWAIQLGYIESEWLGSSFIPQNCKVSVVGNVLYKGADTRESLALVAYKGDAFMEDNAAYEKNGNPAPLISLPESEGKFAGKINILTRKPSWPDRLVPLPSSEVADYIVKHAGARPKERDETDKRIIQDFLNRTGHIIDSQDEVGGYPEYQKTHRKLKIPKRDIEAWLSALASEIE